MLVGGRAEVSDARIYLVTGASAMSTGEFDTSIFDKITGSGTVEQRVSLARQLAVFVSDEEAVREECAAIVPSLINLATDPVTLVRRTLAAALSRTANLHADVLFSIAADSDEIAVDFLRKTPSLDAWQMMAIIKVGEPNKQAAIATRGDLGPQVIEFMTEYAEASVVSRLLDNPCIALEPQNLKRLYVRLTDEPEVIDRLLDRKNLPLEVRLIHAKRTSKRVYHLMAQRGWMAANDAEELVIDTEEATFVKILEDASLEELDRLIPFMCEQQLLTPSIILRAACSGDLELVERSLAYLSSMPAKRVRSLASGRGLKAVLSKAGMPDASLMLVRAVVDVAADARSREDDLSMEQFGCKVIEFVMTRYDAFLADDKAAVLQMIAKFGVGRSKRIASRVQEDLKQAA